MAKGGGDFGYKDPELDRLLDHDDDEEQEVDTTHPFQPGAASTPYQPGAPYLGGEQTEMHTMQHEQSGLPDTSYEEGTPRIPTGEELLARLERLRNPTTGVLPEQAIPLVPPSLEQEEIGRVKRLIKALYPNAKIEELDIRFYKNRKYIVVIGPRRGETKIALEDGTGLQQEFLNKAFVKKALGEPARKLIGMTSDLIRKKQKELEESRKQIADAEKKLREQNELVMSLNERLNREKAKIDQLKDLPEYEEEIKRKKRLANNLEKDFKNATKERKERETKLKKLGDQVEKNARLEASVAEEIKTRNALEERLNQTKPLDDLKEQESELQRQNEEDQAIIRDENASPSDKEAAERRVAERNEELARLQTQIAERERGRPLLERVKEIFKKYGVTLTAILILSIAFLYCSYHI